MSQLFSFILVALCLVAYVQADSWEEYKQKHGKTYSDPLEETQRKSIFMDRLKQIEEHNKSGAKWTMGLNHLSDRTDAEMKRLNGLKVTPKLLQSSEHQNALKLGQEFAKKLDRTNVPDSFDWRDVDGVVTPVKRQGNCGSCWAFSTTGCLEGQQRKLNITLTPLSEQNLVDCSTQNSGCDGGMMSVAMSFIREQGGIDDAKSYPYKERNGICRYKQAKSVMSDIGAAVLSQGDEELLKITVASYGPVSVAIGATERFQSYEGGVFDDPVEDVELNHGVLVVGYGKDKDQGEYWIVKNSWGPKWGEGGYIRMARNKKNQSGIALLATVALIKPL